MNISSLKFGNCEYCLHRHQLLVNGNVRKLEPLALDLLLYLLRNAGRTVSKQELLQAVWYGQSVSAHVISRTMMKLRRAIDGNAPNGLIWTIHGSGYRLAAGVHVATTG